MPLPVLSCAIAMADGATVAVLNPTALLGGAKRRTTCGAGDRRTACYAVRGPVPEAGHVAVEGAPQGPHSFTLQGLYMTAVWGFLGWFGGRPKWGMWRPTAIAIAS